jgi:hypothetical protein
MHVTCKYMSSPFHRGLSIILQHYLLLFTQKNIWVIFYKLLKSKCAETTKYAKISPTLL